MVQNNYSKNQNKIKITFKLFCFKPLKNNVKRIKLILKLEKYLNGNYVKTKNDFLLLKIV